MILQRNPPSRVFKAMRRLRRPESGILFIASLDIFFFVYPALFTRVECDLVFVTMAARIKTVSSKTLQKHSSTFLVIGSFYFVYRWWWRSEQHKHNFNTDQKIKDFIFIFLLNHIDPQLQPWFKLCPSNLTEIQTVAPNLALKYIQSICHKLKLVLKHSHFTPKIWEVKI